jgi:PAS domain S-box-containing protein
VEGINRKLRAELENLRREHERAGRERALLRCILDSANDLIFVKDQHGVYRGCNRASEQFLGLKESEQIGKTDYDFYDAEVADGIRADDRQVMETNQPVRREEWVTYADGHKALMDTVKVPYRGPDGEPLGLVGIARDITERIRAERALKESETKYVDLYENAPDMYASVNTQTSLIEECNMTLANTLGVAKAEIIGRPVFDIYHPDCLNEAKETFQQFVKTGTVHDK